jgi:hypothetical protein
LGAGAGKNLVGICKTFFKNTNNFKVSGLIFNYEGKKKMAEISSSSSS